MFTVVTPFKAIESEHWSERYRHAALCAHELVRAVEVDAPEAYIIRIAVTAWTPGGMPTAEILSAVGTAALGVTPAGYRVEVTPPRYQ